MNINEIRSKYPMYSDLSDQELLDGFHSKFYSDIPKEDFYSKVGFGVKPQKEKASLLESLGSGLKSIPDTMIQGATFAAGGVAGALADVTGSEDLSELERIYFDHYKGRKKELADYEAGIDRGEMGKVMRAVGQIPAYLTPAGMGAMLGFGAQETGATLIDDGASTGHALAGAGADLGSGLAMVAAGPLTNVAGRVFNAALQSGINVGQEALINHPAQNYIRRDAGIRELPDMTSGDYAAAAVPGAVFGAITAKGKGKPVADDTVPELPPKTQADLDSNVALHQKSLVTSIEKQIVGLQNKQAELMRTGSMSEKQAKFYNDLEEAIEVKQGELRKAEGILSKYEPVEPKQTQEDLVQAIQDLDVLGSEKVRTPKQELVSPEETYKGSLVEFSPEGDRVYVKNRAGLERLRTLLQDEQRPRSISEIASELRDAESKHTSLIKAGEYGKAKLAGVDVDKLRKEFFKAKGRSKGEKGSWTPFEEMLPERPDDSDAPGVRPGSSDYAFSEDGVSGGRFDELRRDIRTKWNRGKTESVSDYEARIDKLTESALAKEKTKEAQQPTENDLLKAGIRTEGDVNKRGAFFGFGKNYKSKESAEADLRRLKGLRDATNRSIAKIEGDGKTSEREPGFDTGQGDTAYLYKRRASLDKQIDTLESGLLQWKGKVTQKITQSVAEGNPIDVPVSPKEVKLKSGYAPKDAADPDATKTDSVFRDKAEETLQQLRNDGVTKAKADQIASLERDLMLLKSDLLQTPDRSYARKLEGEIKVVEDKILSEKSSIPGNKQKGMWTPFASSHDTNQKRAKVVSAAFDIENVVDVTNLRSAKDIREQMEVDNTPDSSGSLLQKGERALFGRGQFVEANKRAQPIIWEMAKILRKAKDNEILNKRTWWSGDASALAAKAFGPLMRLSHYKDPQTPEHVKQAATNKDKIAISEYMQEAARNHVNHIQRDTPMLSPEQRAVLDKFNQLTPFQQTSVKVFTKMMEQIRQVRKLPYLAGYIPHARQGDFAVYLRSSQGDPAHLETFPTKAIADNWIKLAKEKGYDVSDVVDFKTPEGQVLAESFGLVRDILDNLNSNDPRRQAWINKVMDDGLAKVSEKPDIGRHREHYTGLTGFQGTKLFKGRLENADDFFKSMEHYAQTSAAQHKKVELIREQNKFWDNPDGRVLREKYPNQAETADFMFDVSMNKDQKYDWTESVDHFRTKVDDLYVDMRNKVREKLGKEPDLLYYPDVPILDRTTGLGAQLFYISALTTRPGFWIGQALTSPFAMRQFLKEGSMADVMAAQGKGWGTVMTGGDAGWKSFVKEMANQSDSLHPQFINEINVLPGLSKIGNERLETLVQVVTGQKPAGMADAFSRYTVAAMAYHHYKNMGMKGDQLAANVRRMVDDTMVMYDREHSPSVFNKMGLVGQNIAPLQKYGLAQLENLIGDLKFIAQKPEGMSTIRAMAPAISTMMTTMIMAGSIGLPLLMEYELLRAAFVGTAKFFGWGDVEDYVPGSVLESMMTNDNILTQLVSSGYEGAGFSPETSKDLATHGALSTATGLDIGSSMRFNPYAPQPDMEGKVSPLSAFPVIKFMSDLGGIVATKVRKNTAGDVTESEDRQATLKVQPVIGMRAGLDAALFDAGERDFVPGGGRGYAQVEQTPKEQLGMLLGSKPLETAKKTMELEIETKHEKKIALQKQKAIDLITDGITGDNDAKLEKGYEMAIRAGMTQKQIKEQIKSVMHERRTPRWEDRFTNRKGQVKSTQQKQRFERMERYGE
jgi:hypothetical protein